MRFPLHTLVNAKANNDRQGWMMMGMTTAVTADSLLLGTSLVDGNWEEDVTFVVSAALDICSLKKNNQENSG